MADSAGVGKLSLKTAETSSPWTWGPQRGRGRCSPWGLWHQAQPGLPAGSLGRLLDIWGRGAAGLGMQPLCVPALRHRGRLGLRRMSPGELQRGRCSQWASVPCRGARGDCHHADQGQARPQCLACELGSHYGPPGRARCLSGPLSVSDPVKRCCGLQPLLQPGPHSRDRTAGA